MKPPASAKQIGPIVGEGELCQSTVNASAETGGVLSGATQVSGDLSRTASPSATLHRVNQKTGQVMSYEVYDSEGLSVKWVNLTGRAHVGIKTPRCKSSSAMLIRIRSGSMSSLKMAAKLYPRRFRSGTFDSR